MLLEHQPIRRSEGADAQRPSVPGRIEGSDNGAQVSG